MVWVKTRNGYVNLDQIEAFILSGVNEIYAAGADRTYPVKKCDSRQEAEAYLERLIERIQGNRVVGE